MIKTVHTGAEVERLIVTGMIVSGDYLRRVARIYDRQYLQVDYARTVAGWCLEHLSAYDDAPGSNIEDIFRSRRRELRDGMDRLAEEFLRQISQTHEQQESFNSEYLFERTRQYFSKRSLLLATEKVEALALDDKVSEAQAVLKDYRAVSADVSPWINPFDDRFIAEVFANLDSNRLLQFPGKIGELIGPLERGWLVGWLGPMKRGKTFWLFECGMQAAMQRLNTVIVSLEMNKTTNAMRIYRRLTALPDEAGEYIYPVFDCGSNQDGTCQMKERFKFNDVPLYQNPDDEDKPKFSKLLDYRPCTFCRTAGPLRFGKGENPYVVDHWYKTSDIERSLDMEAVRRAKGQFLAQFGGARIRFRSYPAYSASLADVESDLDALEFMEGFIPDVIVVDYADILIPPDKRLIERSALDSIWKGLKGMAEKRNCLVITASQSNRGAIKKDNVDQTDVAEDIRKMAHVDAMFGLNQNRSEREGMVMRVNVLAHRHRAFSDHRQAFVLNQLDLGLPCIDSEIITVKLGD